MYVCAYKEFDFSDCSLLKLVHIEVSNSVTGQEFRRAMVASFGVQSSEKLDPGEEPQKIDGQ